MFLSRTAPRAATQLQRRTFAASAARQADFTHAIIGAGAVGLAIARHLAARNGTSTILIERHSSAGTETSSRNSEVIHAGLYYGHGTLKTDLCLRGKHMMYDLCGKKCIPHRNTKKWIVAQDEQQMRELEKVHNFARSINVPTRFLPRDEIHEREPDVRAEAGVLESESTGIVDSHAYMAYLEGDFQERGGQTAFNTAVASIEPIENGDRGYRIYSEGGEEPIEVETLINSAGLFAMAINNMILPEDRHRKPFYAKGSYFSYSSSNPKPKTLLYPAPVPGHGGLGTHLTLDMAGRVRFGPDVEWVDDPTDLSVNDSRLKEAISMIQDYLPGIKRDAINLDYCGIRPKLGKTSGTAGPNFADFYIKEEKGFPGFINLLGIESPGLTSSLAIAEMVDDMLYGSQSKRHHHDPQDEGQSPKFDFHH